MLLLTLTSPILILCGVGSDEVKCWWRSWFLSLCLCITLYANIQHSTVYCLLWCTGYRQSHSHRSHDPARRPGSQQVQEREMGLLRLLLLSWWWWWRCPDNIVCVLYWSFYALGLDILQGKLITSFENVFNMIGRIFKLKVENIFCVCCIGMGYGHTSRLILTTPGPVRPYSGDLSRRTGLTDLLSLYLPTDCPIFSACPNICSNLTSAQKNAKNYMKQSSDACDISTTDSFQVKSKIGRLIRHGCSWNFCRKKAFLSRWVLRWYGWVWCTDSQLGAVV